MTENQPTEVNANANKQAYLEKLISTYKKIFDMEMQEANDIGLVAIAHYMEASKKAFMRSERHEYVYIFDLEKFDKEAFEAAKEFSLQDGLDKIKPTKGYMSTFFTVVILAQNVEADGKDAVFKHIYFKNLKKQKKGYVNQRFCVVDCNNNEVVNNKDSKELGEFLRKFFVLNQDEA